MKKIFTLLTALLALSVGNAFADDATAVFDFQNNPEGWTYGEGAEFEKGNFNSFTVNGVVLAGIQGTAGNPPRFMKNSSRGTFLQIFKNNSIQFTAPDGQAITKIEVTMQSGSFDLSASNGSVESGVWTGNATQVDFTAGATRYAWKFVVTISAKNGETVDPAAATTDAADIAAFNALEDGTMTKLTLTNARVNACWSMNGAYYVEDASGAAVIKGVELTPGTMLNGYIVGKKGIDSSIDPDGKIAEHSLTASDATTLTATPTTLEGSVMTIAEASTQASFGKLITIENVTISGTGRNKTLTDQNGNTILSRDYLGTLSADFTWPAAASKITGVVIYYITGWFVLPLADSSIVAASGDGISNISGNESNAAPVFSLQGVRTNGLRKGINIVGGKKVVVR